MRCTRCNAKLPEPVDGWVTCDKCKLPKFVGVKEEPKKKVEKEEEIEDTN